MTNGQKLKKSLGLENFKYVRINRVVLSSYRILFVWYDSYRKNMPITRTRIDKFPKVATMFHGTDLYHNTNKYAIFTPPMDIEQYNGAIRGTLIIPVDLAGDRFVQKQNYSKVFESKKEHLEIPKMQGNIFEFVTLYDLADAGNISDFTDTWRRDRNRVMGAENITAKLIDCFVNEAEKSVTFGFLTEATELSGKSANDYIDSDYKFYDTQKGEADPEDDWDIKDNRSRTYEIQIKILDFFDWLNVFEGEQIGQKEMKEILSVSNAQISSTSPSFNWQGFAYWLTQIDASIYPQNIKPTQWNGIHGDGQAFLDKHTYGLLRQIKFFINPMASMLNKKLKDRGLI